MKPTTPLWSLLTLSLLACNTQPTEPPQEPAQPAQPAQTRQLPLLEPLPEIEDLDPDENVIRAQLRAEQTPSADTHKPWFYAYNGLNPGPVIRGKVGDTLIVTLDNALDAATTIHWHGLKVPFNMDGVAWRGAPVAAGGSFEYRFTLSHPGTFWYHPHFNTARQVDGGLYGALIVEEPEAPTPDAELVLIFDTENEFNADQDALPVGSPGHHAGGHGKLTPRWRINGQTAPVEYQGRGGSVVRVRMINASNAGYLDLRWPGIRHIANDQGLLPALQKPERILLGPGDRAEVEWLIGEQGFEMMTWPWSLNGGEALGEPSELLRVTIESPAPAPSGLDWPFPGGEPSTDPPYNDILYAFSGSDRTGLWLINGEKFPDVTVRELPYGSEAIIEVRNLSPSEHPFHMHGLDFEVLSVNGQPPAYRTIEDTLNLRIRDTVKLKIRADNVGDWMTHCHILPHAEDGMMTVLRVLEP